MNKILSNETKNILNKAIEAIADETGLKVLLKGVNPGHDRGIDAVVCIKNHAEEIFVEVKNNAQQTNMGAIIEQLDHLPKPRMLVADYINPKMAKRLRRENIQFIDTVGNAYINMKTVYVLVTHQKLNVKLNANDHTNRAFEPKGLIVTYAFLTEPTLLDYPYREIAETTEVALGTVGWVINALKAGGYIQEEVKRKRRYITNYKRLLDRWVEAWPEKLKPKQKLGQYQTENPNWWKGIKIENYQALWGGETAGAFYTNYLTPEVTTVYIKKNNYKKFLRDMRLQKMNATEHAKTIVNLYEPFWQIEEFRNDFEKTNHRIKADPGLVNPILAYADLIATGDTRNIETARRIYDERIIGHYGEH